MSDTPERAGEPVEVKKRRLRLALKDRRTKAGLTQRQAAEKQSWSVSKIVRIEQGTVPVSPNDVRGMMITYGVEDEGEIEGMVALARDTREDKGWKTFEDVLSEATIELIGNEAAAKDIYKYEPSVVPGLMQTFDYAGGLLRALGNSDKQVQRKLQARTQRQQLLDAPFRPTLHYIIGETALARPVGDAESMREQLAYLLELSRRDGINLWVLPFAAGPHRGMGSAFTVMQFADPHLKDLLYLEDANKDSVSRDEADEITDYLNRFVELEELADKHGEFEAQIERILSAYYPRADHTR